MPRQQFPIEAVEGTELDVERARKQFESVLAFVDHLQKSGMDISLNIQCSIGINPQRPQRRMPDFLNDPQRKE